MSLPKRKNKHATTVKLNYNNAEETARKLILDIK